MTIEDGIITFLIASIVALAIIITFDHAKLNALKAQYAACQTSLLDQDNAIKSEQTEKNKIQLAVNNAELTNATIQKNLAVQKTTISEIPNNSSCDTANQWLAKNSAIAAAHYSLIANS